MKLFLPASLQAQISREALGAYPRECCGLIEGVVDGDAFRAAALHPGRNLAQASDRFEIDPADHVAATKAARARGHALIGCYHSHPQGQSVPSQMDRDGAAEENFIWLIAATDGIRCTVAGFVYRGPDFVDVTLLSGADLVTSSLKVRS